MNPPLIFDLGVVRLARDGWVLELRRLPDLRLMLNLLHDALLRCLPDRRLLTWGGVPMGCAHKCAYKANGMLLHSSIEEFS